MSGLARPLIASLLLASPAVADLAPGDPPLSQETADRRRDAVEVVFDIQLTSRQLREHQRLYAWCWTYGPAEWQKAERDRLAAFAGVFDKPAAEQKALREKHRAEWVAAAEARAKVGCPTRPGPNCNG